MAQPINPYVTGNPVGDSPAFVGRKDILDQVSRILRHHRNNAIVLYGQRRIGKTSVLKELEVQLTRQGNYFPVYFDLQNKTTSSLEELLGDLASKLGKVLSDKKPNLGTEPVKTFKDIWLPDLLNQLPSERALVVLFDELDWAIAEAEQASAVFFPYLHELLNIDYKRLNFVFAIGRRIDDISKIALSVFKNTENARISLIDRESTEKLIRFSEDYMTWSEPAIEKVWEQTCGHPYLTQRLCSNIWDKLENANFTQAVTMKDVEAAIPDILKDENEAALHWLWNGLPSTEKLIVSALSNIDSKTVTRIQLDDFLKQYDVRIELNSAIHLLEQWDLIEAKEGGYRFRVELLRRWIAERKPFHKVKIDYDNSRSRAYGYFQEGKKFYERDDLKNALAQFHEALLIQPEHIETRLLVAEIKSKQGNPENAFEILKGLYDYDKHLIQPLYIEVLLQLAQKASTQEEQIKWYERVLELEPKNVEALLKLAELASNKEEQLKWYKRVLELEPENSEAKNKLQNLVSSDLVKAAMFLAEYSDNDDERLMLYYRVLELAPNHKDAKDKRQVILQQQNRHVEKSTHLENQADSLNAVFEEKLAHVDQKIEDIKNSLNHTSQNPLTQIMVITMLITIVILILEGLQILTPAKLEKAVVEQESITVSPEPKLGESNPSFEVLKKENDSLKKELERSKKEIQRLEEKRSPASIRYKITSDDEKLVYIVMKCYGYGNNDRRQNTCAKLIQDHNRISASDLVPGEYIFIPNSPEKECLLEKRLPSCKE